ncbi:hypothetical protein QVD17_09780 [Tagetes erecta]|uniref:NAC domain-containing protein n=1 Tax=Tagetes erecta TaxID=13708 RepID=A0AAD8L4H1_TARER|nr:hypothetical protein QVD17_09780 [Tagetes erecta]
MNHRFDQDDQLDLPPGFRFHPTDEELISHYLHPKVSDLNFVSRVIGEVDLNKVEPWELPWRANYGEQEWFFFCVRDRKYPTGSRTNRATSAGYWKATGKDKEIYKHKSLVGMKKTLVFYKGRAPKGEKTNWVMHEYRLDGKFSTKSIKGDWVISRVFHKSSGGKKIPISGLLKMRNGKNEEMAFGSVNLPPLMEASSIDGGSKTENSNSHVTCFSESMEEQGPNDGTTNSNMYPMASNMGSYQCEDSTWMHDPSIIKIFVDANNDSSLKAEMVDYGVNLGGQVDLDCIWNY